MLIQDMCNKCTYMICCKSLENSTLVSYLELTIIKLVSWHGNSFLFIVFVRGIFWSLMVTDHISMVSCQKGPTRHVYAWQIGPFWQDTLDMALSGCFNISLLLAWTSCWTNRLSCWWFEMPGHSSEFTVMYCFLSAMGTSCHITKLLLL